MATALGDEGTGQSPPLRDVLARIAEMETESRRPRSVQLWPLSSDSGKTTDLQNLETLQTLRGEIELKEAKLQTMSEVLQEKSKEAGASKREIEALTLDLRECREDKEAIELDLTAAQEDCVAFKNRLIAVQQELSVAQRALREIHPHDHTGADVRQQLAKSQTHNQELQKALLTRGRELTEVSDLNDLLTKQLEESHEVCGRAQRETADLQEQFTQLKMAGEKKRTLKATILDHPDEANVALRRAVKELASLRATVKEKDDLIAELKSAPDPDLAKRVETSLAQIHSSMRELSVDQQRSDSVARVPVLTHEVGCQTDNPLSFTRGTDPQPFPPPATLPSSPPHMVPIAKESSEASSGEAHSQSLKQLQQTVQEAERENKRLLQQLTDAKHLHSTLLVDLDRARTDGQIARREGHQAMHDYGSLAAVLHTTQQELQDAHHLLRKTQSDLDLWRKKSANTPPASALQALRDQLVEKEAELETAKQMVTFTESQLDVLRRHSRMVWHQFLREEEAGRRLQAQSQYVGHVLELEQVETDRLREEVKQLSELRREEAQATEHQMLEEQHQRVLVDQQRALTQETCDELARRLHSQQLKVEGAVDCEHLLRDCQAALSHVQAERAREVVAHQTELCGVQREIHSLKNSLHQAQQHQQRADDRAKEHARRCQLESREQLIVIVRLKGLVHTYQEALQSQLDSVQVMVDTTTSGIPPHLVPPYPQPASSPPPAPPPPLAPSSTGNSARASTLDPGSPRDNPHQVLENLQSMPLLDRESIDARSRALKQRVDRLSRTTSEALYPAGPFEVTSLTPRGALTARALPRPTSSRADHLRAAFDALGIPDEYRLQREALLPVSDPGDIPIPPDEGNMGNPKASFVLRTPRRT